MILSYIPFILGEKIFDLPCHHTQHATIEISFRRLAAKKEKDILERETQRGIIRSKPDDDDLNASEQGNAMQWVSEQAPRTPANANGLDET